VVRLYQFDATVVDSVLVASLVLTNTDITNGYVEFTRSTVPEGNVSFFAKAVDAANNVSFPNDNLLLEVDATAPVISAATSTAHGSFSPTPRPGRVSRPPRRQRATFRYSSMEPRDRSPASHSIPSSRWSR
jgi:hypothetical protein